MMTMNPRSCKCPERLPVKWTNLSYPTWRHKPATLEVLSPSLELTYLKNKDVRIKKLSFKDCGGSSEVVCWVLCVWDQESTLLLVWCNKALREKSLHLQLFREQREQREGGHMKDKLLKDSDVITLVNSLLTIMPQDNHLISRCHCVHGWPSVRTGLSLCAKQHLSVVRWRNCMPSPVSWRANFSRRFF